MRVSTIPITQSKVLVVIAWFLEAATAFHEPNPTVSPTNRRRYRVSFNNGELLSPGTVLSMFSSLRLLSPLGESDVTSSSSNELVMV